MDRLLEHLHEEHRRAVHQHEVAGRPHPGAERLGPGIDRPRHDRGAHGQAGLLCRRQGDLADDVAGLDEPRQRHLADDVGSPVVGPVTPAQVVEGVTLAGRGVVEHVLPGEPLDDEGACTEPSSGPGPDLRLVVARPEQLGPDGLGRECLAAPAEDGVGAVPLRQLGDLGGRAHVDAVEHRGAQGLPVGVRQQQARPDTADADADDPGAGRLGQELAAEGHDVGPPDVVGVHLEPSRPWHLHLVRDARGGPCPTVGRDEDALAAARAQVDTEEHVVHIHHRIAFRARNLVVDPRWAGPDAGALP